MKRVAIGVLATAPGSPGCSPELLEGYAPAWVAGLYAAALRDTLDGLLAVDADEHLVFAEDEHARSILERHVHAPWHLVGATYDEAVMRLRASADVVLVARCDAPSADVSGIASAVARARHGEHWTLVGRKNKGHWLIGESEPSLLDHVRLDLEHERREPIHAPCIELPRAISIATIAGVSELLEELRRHPERAPRVAHFLITQG